MLGRYLPGSNHHPCFSIENHTGKEVDTNVKVTTKPWTPRLGWLPDDISKDGIDWTEEILSPSKKEHTRMKAIDMLGKKFGKLTVIQRAPENTPTNKARWLCVCDCGRLVTRKGNVLRHSRSRVQSCGCEIAKRHLGNSYGTGKDYNLRHGHSRRGKKTPTYYSFCSARSRCNNPNVSGYETYGGAGVRFLYPDFESFLNDLGERPEGTTLGRYRDQGNYESGNCAWMTQREQIAEHYKKAQVTPRKSSKLTQEQIRQAQELRAQGMLWREISARFGVHVSTVWEIVNPRNASRERASVTHGNISM